MLIMLVSIFNFISILNIIFPDCNTRQVDFGKYYMFLGDSHCLQFGALAQLPSTKHGICDYPNWLVCRVDCSLKTLFGVFTKIGAYHILVFGTQMTIFHLNSTKNWATMMLH